MNKEKYIGESALNDKPSKKINLMIRNGSITTSKLADGSVTTEKLADGAVSKEKLDSTIHQEIIDSVTASNEATEKAKEATVKADQATENAKQATAAATAAKEAADTATQLATNATTASNQATEQAKAATTKAEEATAKANEAAQKADDSREQTEQTLGTMQEVIDKTAIKDEEGTLVETPFRYIQNEEFIFAKVDAEDKLLFGIQWNGTPVFGKTSAVEDGLQSQVNLLAERVATIMGDEDTTNVIDTMNELKKFFAGIENTQTLTSILANLNSLNTKFGEDIKNLQDTKVDKEEGKSLIEDEVKECFKVIENEEFIKAVVDSEDRVLFGFYRATGKPYYPLNEMYHVEQNEEFFAVWLDAANHVLLGIRRDGQIIGEIHAVNALKQVISQLQSDLTSLQEKVGTIGSNLKELLDVFSMQENPEYLAIEKDADGKVLSLTNVDGSHYIHNAKSETIDAKVDKKEGKSLIDSSFADASTVVEDPEDRMDIKTDEEGKIISFRDKEGTVHEKKAIIGKTVTEEVVAGKVSSDDLNNIYKESTNETIYLDKPSFIELWFTGELPTDLSDERKPTSLRCKFKKEGIVIFECNCTLSIQGHGSTNYAKKGYTFEPYNEKGKALSIKFGDMIATDSFQLKAYATDTLHCRDLGGYALWHDMIEHLDYPYNKFNNIPLTLDKEYNKDAINIEDAFYAPKGFNCACYLNEEFLGLYTLKLKKTRQNYAMFKNNKKQIFLDTYNYKGYFNKGFSADGWEVKNPKIKGYEAGGEISDTEVLSSITRFFDFTKDFGTQKANVDEFMVLPHWLVFIIFEEILHSKDINGNNYNVLTWDGLHWSIIPWDIDITLGLDAWNFLVKTDDAYFQGSVFIDDILKDMRTEYESQIKELYTKWRNEGFLSVLNISKYFKRQIVSVPRYVYEKDFQKWGAIWTNGNPSYEQLVDAISRRLKWLDTQWLNK